MSYRVRRKGKGVKPVVMTAEEICAAIREGRLDLDDIYHEHYGRPDPLQLFGTRMRLGESPVFRQAYADLIAARDEVAAERRRAVDAEIEASMLHGLSGIQVSWRASLISLLRASRIIFHVLRLALLWLRVGPESGEDSGGKRAFCWP
jgi:hypothetical protein